MTLKADMEQLRERFERRSAELDRLAERIEAAAAQLEALDTANHNH